MANHGKQYSRTSLFAISTSHPQYHNYTLPLVESEHRITYEEEDPRPKKPTADTEKVVKYLQEKYNIEIPENFAKTLHEERKVFYVKTLDTVPFKTIDAIIEACKIWLPYIAPESFSALVCAQVKDMFRLHAAAICYTISGKEIKMCIENFVPITSTPPLGLSCCVSYSGRYAINGVYQ